MIYLIYFLASVRLISLIRNEDGPFDIFKTLRGAIGLHSTAELPLEEQMNFDTPFYTFKETFFTKLVSCVWCLSIWTSLFVVFISMNNIGFNLTIALAISEVIRQIDLRGKLDG